SIDSPQLTGTTGRLEVYFDDNPAGAGPRSASGQPGLLQFGQKRRPQAGPGEQLQRFDVAGARVRVRAARGEKIEPTDLAVEGRALFRETRTARPGEKPLLVKGEKLHVTQANTPEAKVNVAGAP